MSKTRKKEEEEEEKNENFPIFDVYAKQSDIYETNKLIISTVSDLNAIRSYS